MQHSERASGRPRLIHRLRSLQHHVSVEGAEGIEIGDGLRPVQECSGIILSFMSPLRIASTAAVAVSLVILLGAAVSRCGTTCSFLGSNHIRRPQRACREVQVLKKAAKSQKPRQPVAIVSYDEKPGIQAIATTAPDLPPDPGIHATLARDHEYKRHGTFSLLAGIDLLTGKVHALVRDRHRSREFVEFLRLLDAAYPASTAIKLILDNHSAHISKEDQKLARHSTERPLRVHHHAHPRLLAQSHRGLLLQVCPLGLASHPGGTRRSIP
jgi:hypothetical protein